MNMSTVVRNAAVALGMSAAALVGVGAVGLASAGSAGAVPREPSCVRIYQTMSDSVDMAQAAYSQGDEQGVNSWMDIYYRASANYDRYCH